MSKIKDETQVWQGIRDTLKSELDEYVFNQWICKIELLGVEDGRLELQVPSVFFKTYLEKNNHVGRISQLMRERTGEDHEVVITISNQIQDYLKGGAPRDEKPALDGGDRPARRESESRRVVSQRAVNAALRLNPEYTFDNFVVGYSNRVANATAQAIAREPGGIHNPFFMYGGSGLGKTHLLQAICHEVLNIDSGANILYITCEEFVNQLITSIQRKQMDSFRYKFRQVDLLVIDDVHFLAGKEHSIEEFFHTFNTLYQHQRQIVLSSDSPPDALDLEERLKTRFKQGLTVCVEAPEYEMRVAILRKKAMLRKLDVPDEVIHYLAENVKTNIRELEGSINTLLVQASLTDQPLDIELARRAFKGMFEEQKVVSVEKIANAVSRYYEVKVVDLQGKKRTQTIAHARHVCMYLARDLTNHSLEEIGGYFGGRDHSTVLHAENTIRKKMEKNEALRQVVENLRRRLA